MGLFSGGEFILQNVTSPGVQLGLLGELASRLHEPPSWRALGLGERWADCGGSAKPCLRGQGLDEGVRLDAMMALVPSKRDNG